MMLFQLTNALKEAAIKQLRIETGNDPNYSDTISHSDKPGNFPFASSFKLEIFDHAGQHTYIVTIVEVNA